jgi:hypothetical protein
MTVLDVSVASHIYPCRPCVFTYRVYRPPSVRYMQPTRVVYNSAGYGLEVGLLVAYYGYIVLGLIAVSRYHHPGWSAPAVVLGVAYMTIGCIAETR